MTRRTNPRWRFPRRRPNPPNRPPSPPSKPQIPFRIPLLENHSQAGLYHLNNQSVTPLSEHFLPFIQRHPDHVWGFWEEALAEALGKHISILPNPCSPISSSPGSGNLSLSSLHLLRRPSSANHPAKPNIQPSHLVLAEQHPLPGPNPCGNPSPSNPPPKMEFHCLEDIPRVFRIPGQLNVAHLLPH